MPQFVTDFNEIHNILTQGYKLYLVQREMVIVAAA